MTPTETAPKRKPGRPSGTPHTGGKPKNQQEFTCSVCETKFPASPSRRRTANPTCSPRCAAIQRERAKGHQPAIEKPCACGCGAMVTRFVSKSSKIATGNVFVNRQHYLDWRWNPSGED